MHATLLSASKAELFVNVIICSYVVAKKFQNMIGTIVDQPSTVLDFTSKGPLLSTYLCTNLK